MKKFISILLSVLLITSVIGSVPFAVSAAEADDETSIAASFENDDQAVGASGGITGDCTWTLDDNGTLTISGNGSMGDYTTYPSGSTWVITTPWGQNIKNIVIENGVTNIGDYAFYKCTGLKNVTIPDSVMRISDVAFGYCTGLTSVTMPNSVTSIGKYAFGYCTSLKSIAIPNSVTNIRSDAFIGCTGLTAVNISDIGAWCKMKFDDISSNPLYCAQKLYLNDELITNLIIPDSVTSIDKNAFYNCTSLTSVDIPDSVTSIGVNAFCNCSNLINIEISDSVTSISGSAFYNTEWYNNISDGLVYAGKVAYKYKGIMPNNTSIIIKDGTKSIADSAFNNCVGLESITIPDSVKSIGDSAFDICTSLTGVYINNISEWCKINFYNSTSNPLYYAHNLYLNNELVTKITIPDSITSINSFAFISCTSLESVIIPNSVTSIESGAFEDCKNLKSIAIPNSVTSIGDYAFKGCAGLTCITIPNSVTSIGDGAFFDCIALTSATIPDSVTSIIDYTFGYYFDDYSYINKIYFFTIYGAIGSAAEKYAKKNGFIFKKIDLESSKIIGDANGDNTVDILDAAAIQKHASGISELNSEQLVAADVNGDGNVDVLDAAEIQKFAAGKIIEFMKKN